MSHRDGQWAVEEAQKVGGAACLAYRRARLGRDGSCWLEAELRCLLTTGRDRMVRLLQKLCQMIGILYARRRDTNS
jgi:hypothetical protein